MSARGPGLGIGEVTRLFGLTPRTVRFYEERGLITATRDRQNCRRYDHRSRATLQLIAQLRRAGVSIPEIRALLETREAGGDLSACAQRLVRARRQALRRQLAELDVVETWLDASAAESASPPRRLARAS